MKALWPRSFLGFAIAMFCVSASLLRAQDVPPDKVFAAVPFAQWVQQGPQAPIPWRVRVEPFGLSLHQRMRAHIDVQLPRRELMQRPPETRMVVLIQLTDAMGQRFRDYTLFRVKDVAPDVKKGEITVFWNLYALPGEYKVTIALFDAESGIHNFIEKLLRIEPPKNDPLSTAWAGLPAVEFLSPRLTGPDAMYRSDVTSRLHLPLATKHPVRMEILADVTASDLFRGSTSFYNRYLAVALPLLKALSEINLERGSLSVAMLDLRRRRVTFEQETVRDAVIKDLDWPQAKAVLAPESGPAMIDIKALEQRRESPAFLQDELLRRLEAAAPSPQPVTQPVHVFVIIGSPMDFYSFRNLPHLPAGSEENCVVYYLQFELLNPRYADGAVGNVRNMLKPLPVHVFKVRSAESVRHALAKILEEVAKM